MTRLSTTYSALIVTLSLAGPAAAYGVEPASTGVHHVGLTTPAVTETAALDGACEVTLTPNLLSILGIKDGFPASTATHPVALACDTQE